jgi:hypothetical protein
VLARKRKSAQRPTPLPLRRRRSLRATLRSSLKKPPKRVRQLRTPLLLRAKLPPLERRNQLRRRRRKFR